MIGEDPNGIPNNLFPLLLRLLSVGASPKCFGSDYNTPDGTGVRDYVHILDLAEAHVRTGLPAGTAGCMSVSALNIGTGVGYSVPECLAGWNKALVARCLTTG